MSKLQKLKVFVSKFRMWQKQVPFPFKRGHQPYKINKNEFVIASTRLNTALRGRSHGIYKFHIEKDRWKQSLKYEKYSLYNIRSAAYDNTKKLLYISILYDMKNSSHIVIFDVQKNKKLNEIHCNSTRFCQLIFMNNQLNRIINFPTQSTQNGNHHVYNNQNNTLNVTHKFFCNHLSDLYGYKLIYLKQKQCVLLFGGHKSNYKISDLIWRFDCTQLIWKQLNLNMPKPLQFFGAIATQNERYIILFGGERRSKLQSKIFTSCDSIWIYDTLTKVWNKSKVRCPIKSKFEAINMHDNQRDELSTMGYVNHCFKKSKMATVQRLPHYLIKVIESYNCQEQIYLLETFTGKHWKINIDSI